MHYLTEWLIQKGYNKMAHPHFSERWNSFWIDRCQRKLGPEEDPLILDSRDKFRQEVFENAYADSTYERKSKEIMLFFRWAWESGKGTLQASKEGVRRYEVRGKQRSDNFQMAFTLKEIGEHVLLEGIGERNWKKEVASQRLKIILEFLTLGSGGGSTTLKVDEMYYGEKDILKQQLKLMANRCSPRRAPIIDIRLFRNLNEEEKGYALWWLNLGCRLNTFEAIQEADIQVFK